MLAIEPPWANVDQASIPLRTPVCRVVADKSIVDDRGRWTVIVTDALRPAGRRGRTSAIDDIEAVQVSLFQDESDTGSRVGSDLQVAPRDNSCVTVPLNGSTVLPGVSANDLTTVVEQLHSQFTAGSCRHVHLEMFFCQFGTLLGPSGHFWTISDKNQHVAP